MNNSNRFTDPLHIWTKPHHNVEDDDGFDGLDDDNDDENGQLIVNTTLISDERNICVTHAIIVWFAQYKTIFQFYLQWQRESDRAAWWSNWLQLVAAALNWTGCSVRVRFGSIQQFSHFFLTIFCLNRQTKVMMRQSWHVVSFRLVVCLPHSKLKCSSHAIHRPFAWFSPANFFFIEYFRLFRLFPSVLLLLFRFRSIVHRDAAIRSTGTVSEWNVPVRRPIGFWSAIHRLNHNFFSVNRLPSNNPNRDRNGQHLGNTSSNSAFPLRFVLTTIMSKTRALNRKVIKNSVCLVAIKINRNEMHCHPERSHLPLNILALKLPRASRSHRCNRNHTLSGIFLEKSKNFQFQFQYFTIHQQCQINGQTRLPPFDSATTRIIVVLLLE